MMVVHNKDEKQKMIIEGVEPLVMETWSVIEIVNKNKQDLDAEDLGDNIDKVALEENLSPKQIQSLSAKYGRK